MKTISDPSAREEIIKRIQSLEENRPAQWGKMNVYQMLRHCRLWEEMALGRTQYKRAFIGLLFGRLALKDFMKDKPMMRNAPTIPALRIGETRDFFGERAGWIGLIGEYPHSSGIVHPFFGKMNSEQVGYMSYKHADHHLRQFDC